jgi:hypothetical protein
VYASRVVRFLSYFCKNELFRRAKHAPRHCERIVDARVRHVVLNAARSVRERKVPTTVHVSLIILECSIVVVLSEIEQKKNI